MALFLSILYGKLYGMDRSRTKSRATSSKGGRANLRTAFIDRAGMVQVDRLATSLGMSKAGLAETLGVSPETLRRRTRAAAPKTQARLKEMLEIVTRVEAWAGGSDQALAWYRAQPLPEFGGRTAESLVQTGQAVAVRRYLDHVALGGFV